MVACGDEHAGFITSNLFCVNIAATNLIYSMGSNVSGQLGINDMDIKMKNSPVLVETLMDKKPKSISCGAYHSVICTGKKFYS